jgi:hypothetical protein
MFFSKGSALMQSQAQEIDGCDATRRGGVAQVILVVLALSGCSLFKTDTTYNPVIDPAQFVKGVDNPFLPLVPGTTMRYRISGDEGTEDNTLTVMPDTKMVAGVPVTVVHDVVSAKGQIREDTWDWYAQDRAGNVWYFGEDTKEYQDGRISTKGSWEAGVRGAKPGIVMPAQPKVGRIDRQEYLVGEAEDEGQVIALDETVTVSAGRYSGCVKTKEWSRLEPGVTEHKYYAPGVGLVTSVMVEGGTEHVELIGVDKK